MPHSLTGAGTAAQLARILVSPRKLLLISSHTERLAGNALGLALAAQSSPDFMPVFLVKRSAPGPTAIPTWRRSSRLTPLLWKRADVIAFTGRYSAEFPRDRPRPLQLFLWHGMPIKGIGAFDSFTKRTRQPCDLAIATSERTSEIMSQSLGLAPERIKISGEPKTDYLPTDRLGWDWCASLRRHYRAIIGYFPTWREKVVPIDGKPERRRMTKRSRG
jgi:hypothetical protein